MGNLGGRLIDYFLFTIDYSDSAKGGVTKRTTDPVLSEVEESIARIVRRGID